MNTSKNDIWTLHLWTNIESLYISNVTKYLRSVKAYVLQIDFKHSFPCHLYSFNAILFFVVVAKNMHAKITQKEHTYIHTQAHIHTHKKEHIYRSKQSPSPFLSDQHQRQQFLIKLCLFKSMSSLLSPLPT